jgi:hypothetical protein
VAHLPISDAQVRAHFAAALLAGNPARAINQELQKVTGAKLVSIQVSEPNVLVAMVSTSGAFPRARVRLTVDSAGLISDLPIRSAPGPA